MSDCDCEVCVAAFEDDEEFIGVVIPGLPPRATEIRSRTAAERAAERWGMSTD